jgi:hypothetical protein
VRSRIVKPNFFKNEDLARLDPLARILFEGLWCMADREGRIEDRPARIKAEVLPYDAVNIDELLDALAVRPGPGSDPFIIRYTVEGRRFIQITNPENLNPAHREPASQIPPPDMSTDKTRPRHGLGTDNTVPIERDAAQIVPKSPESLSTVSRHGLGTAQAVPDHDPEHVYPCPDPDPCPDPPPTPHTSDAKDPARSYAPPGPSYREIETAAKRLWPRLAVHGIPRRFIPDIVGALERHDTPEAIVACLEDASRNGQDIGWAVRFRVSTGWSPVVGTNGRQVSPRERPQPTAERDRTKLEDELGRAGVQVDRGPVDAS